MVNLIKEGYFLMETKWMSYKLILNEFGQNQKSDQINRYKK